MHSNSTCLRLGQREIARYAEMYLTQSVGRWVNDIGHVHGLAAVEVVVSVVVRSLVWLELSSQSQSRKEAAHG